MQLLVEPDRFIFPKVIHPGGLMDAPAPPRITEGRRVVWDGRIDLTAKPLGGTRMLIPGRRHGDVQHRVGRTKTVMLRGYSGEQSRNGILLVAPLTRI